MKWLKLFLTGDCEEQFLLFCWSGTKLLNLQLISNNLENFKWYVILSAIEEVCYSRASLFNDNVHNDSHMELEKSLDLLEPSFYTQN